MSNDDLVNRRELLARAAGAAAAAWTARSAAAAPAPAAPAPAAPGPWQIGCYTRPWADEDWRTAFDAIAEAGYKHVGLMTTKAPSRLILSAASTVEDARTVAEEARKRGMAIPSAWCGDIPVGKSLEAGIEALRKNIDNCSAAGVRNLLMGGTGKPELQEPYYKAIKECCDYAAAKGIGISVKPHGGLNATGAQCRKAVEQVGHKNFRLWYDPGNIMFYSDGALDPATDAAAVADLVVGMCVKDYLPPKNVNVTPGTGKVDFAAVLSRLKAGGFTSGALVVECLAPGDRAHTLQEARKARLFLEELTAATA
ncbi:MAG: sugar phosphate isomerase/epimerase [Planctomycetes bacterium]|nr:sugar phosphate isomerase/epimerase [Planctomycetota bacterium]